MAFSKTLVTLRKFSDKNSRHHISIDTYSTSIRTLSHTIKQLLWLLLPLKIDWTKIMPLLILLQGSNYI